MLDTHVEFRILKPNSNTQCRFQNLGTDSTQIVLNFFLGWACDSGLARSKLEAQVLVHFVLIFNYILTLKREYLAFCL